ncbi:hypothetical protein LJC18_02435 [Lachnospiraceae bacterium OttesenSCG-928-E19]|nr:hypothetical protein [Lachnospiraceae bacterium OttesenSCG-928-E19]
MKYKTANIIAGLSLVLAVLCWCFVRFNLDIKIIFEKDSDWVMAFATCLMALFALFSWLTALSQRKIQKQSSSQQNKIMDEQKDIARKEYLRYRLEQLFLLTDLMEVNNNEFMELFKKIEFSNTFSLDDMNQYYKLRIASRTVNVKIGAFYINDELYVKLNVLEEKIYKEMPMLGDEGQEMCVVFQNNFNNYIFPELQIKNEIREKIALDIKKIGIELQQLEK